MTPLRRRHRIPTGSDSQFWLVPLACAFAALALAFAMVCIDRAFPGVTAPFLFQGSSSGARDSLDAIVTAMISLTGIVFSLAFVAVQLSSGQHSPRVLQIYLRDRIIQFTFGLFVATFLYALLVAQSIKPDHEVPRIAVTVAAMFVLASAAIFMVFVGRAAYMMRASTIIAEIADASSAVLERTYPTGAGPSEEPDELPTPCRTISASRRGVLIRVDERRLADAALRAGCVVTLRLRIGDFVPNGGELLAVHGGTDRVDWLAARVRKHISLGIERTMTQDLAFGFRQLIDIVIKGLSPSVNDPTTACQSLDALHDLLRQLATRPPARQAVTDADGALRLVIPRYQFADLLDVTVRETRRYGSDAAQVPDRIAAMLTDLAEVARPEHQPAVQHWIEVVNA